MNVGANIRKLRKEKKLTLKELGMKVGLSEQAIGQYERGDRTPNIENLNKIAKALKININDLLTNNEDKEKAASKKVEKISFSDETDLMMYAIELDTARIKNNISIHKISELLDIDPQTLEQIGTGNKVPNVDIIVKYASIIDKLSTLRESLIMNIIDFGIFDNYNSVDLNDLLSLSGFRYQYFISNLQKYIKFALEDAKTFQPSKDFINSFTEILSQNNEKEGE